MENIYEEMEENIIINYLFSSFSSKIIIVDQVKRIDILNQAYSIPRFSTFQLN